MHLAIDSRCLSYALVTESVGESVTSGSRDTRKKDDAACEIGAELHTIVRIALRASSQSSYATSGDSIPSGERESFSVFSPRGIPE